MLWSEWAAVQAAAREERQGASMGRVFSEQSGGLGKRQQVVLAAVKQRYGDQNVRDIVERTGYGRREVVKALDVLHKRGLIEYCGNIVSPR